MKFLNSFNDLVINESINLLLEGKLIGSQRFLNKLKNLSSNKIGEFLNSQFLSNHEHEDLPQNIIDITDKDDVITFISDKAFSKLGIDTSSEEAFSTKGRSETRIGRFVRSLSNQLGQKFSDKEIEDFVNMYKASESSKDDFKLVSGEEIKNYYLLDSYFSESKGTLGNSCMRYPECQDYFDIYVKNPGSCQMLILLNKEGKLLGRALVWKIFQMNLNKECSAEYFMDRVYTYKDSDAVKFRNVAESKGWLYRKRDSNSSEYNTLVYVYKGSTLWGKIVVEMNPGLRIREFPFVDSLSFTKGRYLSNVGFGRAQKVLCDTEGGYSTCDTCSNTGKEEIDYCPKCIGSGTVKCPKCDCGQCDDGSIKCSKCDAGYISCSCDDGYISCSCDDGSIKCDQCKGEGSNQCQSCKGEGDLGSCKKCNNKPFTCKVCDGKGQYYRKWGNGKRLVNCVECSGEGSIKPRSTLNIGENSPNKCDCFVKVNSWSWNKLPKGTISGYNDGIISCKDCDGDGYTNCEKCYGDGNCTCEKCNGDGNFQCKKCDGNGSFDCEDCEGGYNDCENCNGVGRIKKLCKPRSSDCSDGRVTCPSCKGTGTPSVKERDCPACVGIDVELNNKISRGEFTP